MNIGIVAVVCGFGSVWSSATNTRTDDATYTGLLSLAGPPFEGDVHRWDDQAELRPSFPTYRLRLRRARRRRRPPPILLLPSHEPPEDDVATRRVPPWTRPGGETVWCGGGTGGDGPPCRGFDAFGRFDGLLSSFDCRDASRISSTHTHIRTFLINVLSIFIYINLLNLH